MTNIKYRLIVVLAVVLVFSAVIVPQMNQNNDVYSDADICVSMLL